jgi:hypothetical protein
VRIGEFEKDHFDPPSREGARRNRGSDRSEERELVFAPPAAVDGLPKTLRSAKDQSALETEVEGSLDARPLRGVSRLLETEDRAVADATLNVFEEAACATA